MDKSVISQHVFRYIYPAEHNFITMKNDKTLYRIQSKHYWISQCPTTEDIDYGML